jgi:type II secretory pathway pseudopilin PulG
MTLIELTVVLLILIGLAGLLIPYVGSFVQKTHDSTNSNNLASLNNSFVRYVTENNRLPQHMDSLTNSGTTGTGVCTGTLVVGDPYCALLDPGVFTAAAYTIPTDPAAPTDGAEVAYMSLYGSKISMVVNNNPAAPNKTFGSYTGMVNIDPYGGMGAADFAGIKVAGMRTGTAGAVDVTAGAVERHLAAALGKDEMDYDATCYDYVAFGLGDANGLVTKTIASAPVHYPEDATKGPVDYYNHYIAIVQVDKANTGTGYMGRKCSSITEPAKFLGVAMNVPSYPGSKLFGVNASLAYGYENQLAGK